ncbi:MAG: hypothetical protein DRI95_02165 [Bacteroidetes bacterium]|nr:MAG: hypothetical protein DRI95_02165 [Bacteroidota bacterium]
MNIAKAYTKGFIQTAKFPRMLFILYFANILMALIFALPFFSALKNSAGNSDFLNGLLEGFDFTVFSNLMYYSGKAFAVLTGSIKWLVLAYFLLSVFLTGGIIRSLNDDKFSTSSFFGAGAHSFFRFLGLSLIIVLFQIIFLLLIFIPVGMYIGKNFSEFQSEITAYYIGFSALGLYALVFLLISMIGDYGKFYLELNNSFNIFKGFWGGVKYVFKHFLKTYVLYLILLFLPAVIMYVYLYLEQDIKMATGIGILLVFLMQQSFILLRVFLRTWILSSQLMIYDDDFLQLAEVELVVQAIVEKKVKEMENQKEIFSESIRNMNETEIKEKIEEKPEPKIEETKKIEENEENSDYEIDFDKTFAKTEVEKDKVLSEEDMLKKMEDEEEEEFSRNNHDDLNEPKG